MAVERNYFFVDGSSLLADLKRVRAKLKIDSTQRFNIIPFVRHFVGHDFFEYHSGSYRRFVFYFVQNDDRIKHNLIVPDFTQPTVVGDVHIQYCGKKVRQAKRTVEWLEERSAPTYVMDRLYKSEKAVDTQICCDALQLAGTGNLERLFLYTNDYDFIPLCKTLRQLGANTNLFRLRKERVNKDLVTECDAFHVMNDDAIRECFE